jgi:hypothetical protein
VYGLRHGALGDGTNAAKKFEGFKESEEFKEFELLANRTEQILKARHTQLTGLYPGRRVPGSGNSMRNLRSDAAFGLADAGEQEGGTR